MCRQEYCVTSAHIRQGEVVLVGSSCSMINYTGYASYAPSKYAVKAIADGMRNEIGRHNVRVSMRI